MFKLEQPQLPRGVQFDVDQLKSLRTLLDGIIRNEGVVDLTWCDQTMSPRAHLQVLESLGNVALLLRDGISTFLAHYRALYSSRGDMGIYQLPDEILMCIIKQCHPGYANLHSSFNRYGDVVTEAEIERRHTQSFALSWVSRRFRGVSLWTPTLWNCLLRSIPVGAIVPFIVRGRAAGIHVYLTGSQEPKHLSDIAMMEYDNWISLTVDTAHYVFLERLCLVQQTPPKRLRSVIFARPSQISQYAPGSQVQLLSALQRHKPPANASSQSRSPQLSRFELTSRDVAGKPQLLKLVEYIHSFHALQELYLEIDIVPAGARLEETAGQYAPNRPAQFPRLKALSFRFRAFDSELPHFCAFMRWLPIHQLQYLHIKVLLLLGTHLAKALDDVMQFHGPMLPALTQFSLDLREHTRAINYDPANVLAMMPSLQVLELEGKVIGRLYEALLMSSEQSAEPIGRLPPLQQVLFRSAGQLKTAYLRNLVLGLHRQNGNEPVYILASHSGIKQRDAEEPNGLVESVTVDVEDGVEEAQAFRWTKRAGLQHQTVFQ